MLASWTIENFKSIAGKLELPLSPITVLVGANSSGKSSIIQSILLIKQTLQYATADKPIALNGPILKLGSFDDIQNVNSSTKGVSIGWRYDESKLPSSPDQFTNRVSSKSAYFSPSGAVISEIEVHAEFGVDFTEKSEFSRLQPLLFNSSMKVFAEAGADAEPASAYVELVRVEGPPDPSAITSQPLSLSARQRPTQRYAVGDIDLETRASILEDHPKGEIVGALVRHFLPLTIGVSYDSELRRATLIAEAISSLRKSLRFQREFAQLAAPSSLLSLLSDWAETNKEFFSQLRSASSLERVFEQSQTIGDVVDALLVLRSRSRMSFPSLQELLPRIVEALTVNSSGKYEIDLVRPRLVYEAANLSRDYFETYVRYLGPLRDEPKPLYPLEALGNPSDVGFRGEHTAAVLHLNQYRNLRYIRSGRFSESSIDSSLSQSASETSLHTALVDWLGYMGVIEDVSIDDRGKIGHELQVKTPGIEKFHDLTNVGVGVSQVLPIVLMALLAPAGSLLIFEQPELHLHPKVQTRLADFFISMAMLGKQCLLETHSEYLIHRLRRRIAEAPDDDLTNLSKLYFVERSGGVTGCKAVDISKYGAVLDWPADFFDESQNESENILKAASSKRSKEKLARKPQNES